MRSGLIFLCLISDKTDIRCQPIPGDTLWSQVSLHRNECLQCFLIVKMFQKAKHINHKYYRCKILPQVFNHMKKTRPPTSEQAGCICSMTMPPRIKLKKWEIIWLSTRSRFCLTLPTALTLPPVMFGYFLCWLSTWQLWSLLGATT